MQKIKLTKHELKRHKENLRRYNRFLPTLTAKKQQLQREIVRIRGEIKGLESTFKEERAGIMPWVSLLAEDVGLEKMVRCKGIRLGADNIAGVDIPGFEGVDLAVTDYDLLSTPLWVDWAIEKLGRLMVLDARIDVLKKQIALLAQELLVTTQRVNLFEKVKIPEAIDAIRRIAIHLGDQQTAAVVWAKMAKKKLQVQGI
ncbi:MAG: V-type ATP synthase subunit D [Deltaproteobacteria bacterium]|nr:V-type ATP synthase subunit D [Deltaproteobacteria bacterium]